MNIGAMVAMANKLGIKINYQAIGTIMSIWDKKADELVDSDVKSVVNLINPDASDDLIAELTRTINTADGDTLASYLGDEDKVMSMAKRVVFSDARLIERLEKNDPFVPIRCPKCGHDDQVSRVNARLDAANNGSVTVHCINCDSSREIPYKAIALYGI